MTWRGFWRESLWWVRWGAVGGFVVGGASVLLACIQVGAELGERAALLEGNRRALGLLLVMSAILVLGPLVVVRITGWGMRRLERPHPAGGEAST